MNLRELIILKMVFLAGYATGYITQSKAPYAPPPARQEVRQPQHPTIDQLLRESYGKQ